MEKQDWIGRYKRLGWEFEGVKPKTCIRLNSLRCDPKKTLAALKKKGVELAKVDFLTHGYYVLKTPFNLVSTVEYLLGHFYIQDAASQFAVELLDARPGQTVLDMCAAPGGKTTHIAQSMDNTGSLVAIELKRERLIALKNNLERMGVTNCAVFKHDARKLDSIPLRFDRILLDAPCSGNFTLERDWFKKRDLDGVKGNAKLQRELLGQAAKLLKPKGILTYATCSLEPEEDEEQTAWAEEALGLTLIEQRRFWPKDTTGFFAARLQRP